MGKSGMIEYHVAPLLVHMIRCHESADKHKGHIVAMAQLLIAFILDIRCVSNGQLQG
jgi:hypothetical protein